MYNTGIIVTFLMFGPCVQLQAAPKPTKSTDILLGNVWEHQFTETPAALTLANTEVTKSEAKARGWKRIPALGTGDAVSITYPKVSLIADSASPWGQSVRQIQFLDLAGKPKKKVVIQPRKRERVHASLGGRYFAVARRPRGASQEAAGGTLYRDDGTELWSKAGGLVPLAVSDNGYVVANHPGVNEEPPGEFVFFGPNGKELARVSNPLSKLPTGWASANFSTDGNFVALRVTDTRSKSVVVYCTRKGKVVWQEQLDYLVHVLEVSSESGVFGQLVKSRKGRPDTHYIFRITSSGVLEWKSPIEVAGALSLAFSRDKKRLFAASSTGRLLGIDVASGNLVWKHRESWAPRRGARSWPENVPQFRQIDVLGRHVLVAAAYQGNTPPNVGWHASALLVFDAKSGNLLSRKKFPGSRMSLLKRGSRHFVLDAGKKKILSVEIKEPGQ